jgi:hypothetical protein
MIDYRDFPRLTPNNHRVTSPPSADYNCIAWAREEVERWWQPGVYWPVATPLGDYSDAVLEQMFLSLGFENCGLDASAESGFEKVALYAEGVFYTHAARQLPTGKWTSKLGKEDDVEHDTPDDVAGGVYGALYRVMRRPFAVA